MRFNVIRRWRQGAARPHPAPAFGASDYDTVSLSNPTELLDSHCERLAGLRLESGYSDVEFETFIQRPLLQCAQYIHQLPASRAENHREMGGLFRFAFETACLAFRRADGRLFDRSDSASASSRGDDLAWRYAAFLAGLCSPLGRAHGVATVRSADGIHTWNPYAIGLCQWAKDHQLDRYTIDWRRRQDARATFAESVWLAARLLDSGALNRLQASDHAIAETFIDVLSGQGGTTLSDVVAESTQAVVDQDLAVSRAANDIPMTGIRVEHRLLDAIRGLVRDKWTSNTAGSRVWVTEQGVFLNWRPAVNDILVRLRSDGVAGLPNDPDTLAELLVEKSVLANNPSPTSARVHRHYFRLTIHAPQIPKHPMDCVQLVNASLLGLQLDTISPLPVVISGGSRGDDGDVAVRQAEMELAQVERVDDDAHSALPAENASESRGAKVDDGAQSDAGGVAEPASLPVPTGLLRYGLAGEVLAALLQGGTDVFIEVTDGIALAFPDAVKTVCVQPKDFLSSCQSQSLVVPAANDRSRVVRKRQKSDDSLPDQYIVLAPRLARPLGLPKHTQ